MVADELHAEHRQHDKVLAAFPNRQGKRFHHKDQGRACWRGVLPARWLSAPPVARAARGLPRAALRAPTLQVLNLEPHENTLPIIHDMQLDKHNKHRLHNKLEGTGEQAEVPAAPSHLNAAAAGAAAAARASPPEPIAAAECLPPEHGLPGCHAGCIVVLAAVAPLSADALLLLLERLHLVPLTQHPPAHPHTHDIRTNTHLISTSSTHHTLHIVIVNQETGTARMAEFD